MKTCLALLLAITASAMTFACSSGEYDEAAEQSGSAQTQTFKIDPRVALAGQEWARCWFKSPGEDLDKFDFVCKRTPTPGYPYSVGDIVVSPRELASDRYLGGSGSLGPLRDTEDGVEQNVGRDIARTDFPLRISTRAKVYSFNDTRALDDTPTITYGNLVSEQRLLAPPTEAEPIIVKQPFDLWPLLIVNFGSVGYELSVPNYKFSIGSLKLQSPASDPLEGGSELEAKLESFMSFNGRKTAYLPAPIAGKINAKIAPRQSGARTSGTASEFVFDGPGIFIWEDTGLRRATREEITQLAPELPPTN